MANLREEVDGLNPKVIQFFQSLSEELEANKLEGLIDGFSELKVLVVGDTIIDRYSYLKVQGLTSKNRIISGRFLSEETHAGGALAVYRHIQGFTNNVRFVSLVGVEPWVDSLLREYVQSEHDLVVREPSFTTVLKQRFVEPVARGKELIKLFSVNFIDGDPPGDPVTDRVLSNLSESIGWADVVVVADFGHGLLQSRIREYLQESGAFLALNCQTNSNNHGFNIISRQYKKVCVFALDQQELMLSCGHRHIDFAAELESLRCKLGAKRAWLTRGPVETIGLDETDRVVTCPPLEDEVVDTVGAGDAFFSVALLAAASNVSTKLGTFLGQLAGAQAVKTVGNAQPVSKELMIKRGVELLKL